MNKKHKNNMKITIFNISKNGPQDFLQDYYEDLYVLTLDSSIKAEVRVELQGIYDEFVRIYTNRKKGEIMKGEDVESIVSGINRVLDIVLEDNT